MLEVLPRRRAGWLWAPLVCASMAGGCGSNGAGPKSGAGGPSESVTAGGSASNGSGAPSAGGDIAAGSSGAGSSISGSDTAGSSSAGSAGSNTAGKCAVGEQLCGAQCANLNTAAHCGSCDKACKSSEICAVDSCISNQAPCPDGLDRCADACVNLQSGLASCGGCDIVCAPAQTCTAGKCVCPKGAACESSPLLLSVGPTQHYLVSATGVPFQLRGDAPWTASVQLTREDVTTYLDDRQKKLFNTILIEVIEDKFGSKAPANAYGDLPFAGGDFTAPNEPYWKHIDYIVSSAAAHDIVVLMCPLYLGYGGGDEGWYAAATKAGAPAIETYGAFLGTRYGAADNIIWVNGGDFYPPTLAIPDALAKGILSKDKRHLFTTHWARNSSGRDGGASWLTLNSSYTDQGNISSRVLADYQARPLLPTFVIESQYEGSFTSEPTLTAKDVRTEAWQATLSGAAGYIFGNHTIWPFSAGWPQALASDGAKGMANLHTFFAAIPWWTLVPDAGSALVTAGRGTSGTAQYVAAAASADGKLGVVYLPNGGEISVSLAKFQGSVSARWFDPSAGTFSDVSGSPLPATGVQKLTAPGSTDSVLLLKTL